LLAPPARRPFLGLLAAGRLTLLSLDIQVFTLYVDKY
jgi:hypothetical protein